MIIATVVTPWVLVDDMYSPKVIIDYPLPLGSSYVDITSQQNILPNPNLYIVELSIPDEYESYVDAIENDTRYAVITAETEA